MAVRRNPTVRRRRLAIELRQLRLAAGVSLDDAGRHIGRVATTVSRMENAQSGFKPEYVEKLLDLYGVTDPTMRETLTTLARESRQKGWWHSYGDVLPQWFEVYVGLESAASLIRTYQVKAVHGLLQTEDYARAVLTAGRRFDSLDEAERQVALRMQRQQALTGDDPTEVMMIVDESALRRPVGGRSVMRAQLDHLVQVSTLPNVEIQVLPDAAGEQMLLSSAFTLLKFPAEPTDPAVVYLEYLGGSLFLDKPEDATRYERGFNYLQMIAFGPKDSVALISAIAKEE